VNQEIETIFEELTKVFSDSQINYDALSEKVSNSDKIVCLGAGRVGLVMEAFAKRLTHLGKLAYTYTDSNLPKTTRGDLLIIGSGSGNTKSIVTISKIAFEKGLDLVLLTANPESEISKLSKFVHRISSPYKGGPSLEYKSAQPMTTLFEQSLYIWLDGFVLHYMKKYSISEFEMKDRHNELE
jgi:6-phospho-3-hexuloisomerase